MVVGQCAVRNAEMLRLTTAATRTHTRSVAKQSTDDLFELSNESLKTLAGFA